MHGGGRLTLRYTSRFGLDLYLLKMSLEIIGKLQGLRYDLDNSAPR